VESFILDVCNKLGLGAESIDRIMISVTEAVNNAIIHGNRADPTKKVCLECESDGSRIEFIVRDEGAGFEPDHLPDPRANDNLLKEGGRGVLLIRAFMDSVSFTKTPTGMEVRLGISI
jgi:serine/threonine-protein kinase RsbW